MYAIYVTMVDKKKRKFHFGQKLVVIVQCVGWQNILISFFEVKLLSKYTVLYLLENK